MAENFENIAFDYAQIGGVRLHYAQAGEGDKLVLLLHGFPEFWYSWRHQLTALSSEYTVVAPDLRGYNLSDKPEHVSDYAMEKLVDDVTGLIRYFGYKEAAVIGHDWGAAIAWATAHTNPETLWKVGALQVPPPAVLRKNQSFSQLLASWYMFFFQLPAVPEWWLSRNDFAVLAASLRTTTADTETFNDEEIARFKKAWSEPNALTSQLNYYRANILRSLFSPASESFGKKITVPSLFVYGEQDSFILPETVKNIGEFIDAPFEEYFIPNSGHWVQQEQPETVTQILREFLAK